MAGEVHDSGMMRAPRAGSTKRDRLIRLSTGSTHAVLEMIGRGRKKRGRHQAIRIVALIRSSFPVSPAFSSVTCSTGYTLRVRRAIHTSTLIDVVWPLEVERVYVKKLTLSIGIKRKYGQEIRDGSHPISRRSNERK